MTLSTVFVLQDRLATDAWKIIAALKKEKGDLEVGNHIFFLQLQLYYIHHIGNYLQDK